jgi:hypothetical protein
MFGFIKKTKTPSTPFRQSLFWDTDTKELDVKKHSGYIINRILSRGDIADFAWAKEIYGEKKIKAEAEKCETLDKKSQNFWYSYFNISPLCMKKQSPLKQSSFWTR